MSKQTIEIDLPDGWVGVKFGIPRLGEWFIGVGGYPVECRVGNDHNQKMVVRQVPREMPIDIDRMLRPMGCKGLWFAFDDDGSFHWYKSKPYVSYTWWITKDLVKSQLPYSFKKPDGLDWKECVWQLPPEPSSDEKFLVWKGDRVWWENRWQDGQIFKHPTEESAKHGCSGTVCMEVKSYHITEREYQWKIS